MLSKAVIVGGYMCVPLTPLMYHCVNVLCLNKILNLRFMRLKLSLQMSYIALLHITLDNSEVGLCSVYTWEVLPARVWYSLSYTPYCIFCYRCDCINVKIMYTDPYLYIL